MVNLAGTTPPGSFPEAIKPTAPALYCFSADNVLSALAMASSALACKNRCLMAALNDSAELAACNADLLQQLVDLKASQEEERVLAEKQVQNMRGQVQLLEQQWATAQQQLAQQAQCIKKKDAEYMTKVKLLEQEQELRLHLEDELLTCQQAAGELREQISAFLKEGELPSPGTDATMVMEHMLESLGPGFPWIESAHCEESPDTKIKADMSAMEQRLKVVTKLHTPGTTPLPTP